VAEKETLLHLPIPAGSFVRRVHDGMLGRAERAHTREREGQPEVDQEVRWLGEWAPGNLYTDLVHGRRAVLLEGAEAEAARVAFAAITCPTCAGTGRRDRVATLPISDPAERCPSRSCAGGRRLGVDERLDASYATWKHETAARETTARLYTEAGRSRAELEAARATPERPVTLRFPATCLECGRRIPVGEKALVKRADERWTIRCMTHA
jgi:hypothetical protein